MKIRKSKRATAEISTASLPDIIFMLLFFFMTVTVLRTASAQLAIELPSTETSIKVNHEASEYNIYLRESSETGEHHIQINEYLVTITQLDQILKDISLPLLDFEKLEIPIYLRVDKKVKMDFVYNVKLLLRKHGLRKINYIVDKSTDI